MELVHNFYNSTIFIVNYPTKLQAVTMIRICWVFVLLELVHWPLGSSNCPISQQIPTLIQLLSYGYFFLWQLQGHHVILLDLTLNTAIYYTLLIGLLRQMVPNRQVPPKKSVDMLWQWRIVQRFKFWNGG